MEFVLNFAWALLAVFCAGFWLRMERRSGPALALSATALVVLIFILFPVISVSDDLWSMQNPAETDTCLRRDHGAICPHSIVPVTAALPVGTFTHAGVASIHVGLLPCPTIPATNYPASSNIHSRPPPIA